MEPRWKETVVKIGVFWILIPAAVGALGFFGVRLFAPKPSQSDQEVMEQREESVAPVQDSANKDEKWTMPDAPEFDVQVTVEKADEEYTENKERVEELQSTEPAAPKEIAVPENAEEDEAGIGGFVKPPEKQSPPPPTEGDGIG